MKLTLNLASRSYVNRRAFYFAYAGIIAALVLLLAFNLSRVWRLYEEAGRFETQLDELETRLVNLRESSGQDVTQEALAQQRAEVDFANEILVRDGFRWTSLLDRLEKVVVEGVAIRSLQPDYQDQSLRMTGNAHGLKNLREFLDLLIADPTFSEVYLLQQSTDQVKTPAGGERQVVRFSLVLKGVF